MEDNLLKQKICLQKKKITRKFSKKRINLSDIQNVNRKTECQETNNSTYLSPLVVNHDKYRRYNCYFNEFYSKYLHSATLIFLQKNIFLVQRSECVTEICRIKLFYICFSMRVHGRQKAPKLSLPLNYRWSCSV